MGNQETEVLVYKYDITDVEAKAQRLQQLLADQKAKQTAGEDTSEIERQIRIELDGFAKLGQAKKKDLSEGEGLIKQKERLANIVTLLGGRFGGLIGNLGGVIELMMSLGRTTAIVAGSLAAITGVTQVYDYLKQKIAALRKEQEGYNAAVDEMQRAKLGTAATLGGELAKYGLATGENVNTAQRLNDELRRQYGIDDTAAVAIAMASGGKSVEDVAVLAMMQRREEGGPSSSDEARKALEKARETGTYNKILAEAQEYSKTTGAQEVRIAASAPGARGIAGRPAPEIAFEELRQRGLIPENMSQEEFEGAQGRIKELESGRTGWWGRTADERAELERLKKIQPHIAPYQKRVRQISEIQSGGGSAGAPPEVTPPPESDEVGQFLEDLKKDQKAGSAARGRGPISMPTPPQPVGLTTGGGGIPVVNNTYITTNIGTQHNIPDRRHPMRGNSASIHPSGATMRGPD